MSPAWLRGYRLPGANTIWVRDLEAQTPLQWSDVILGRNQRRLAGDDHRRRQGPVDLRGLSLTHGLAPESRGASGNHMGKAITRKPFKRPCSPSDGDGSTPAAGVGNALQGTVRASQVIGEHGDHWTTAGLDQPRQCQKAGRRCIPPRLLIFLITWLLLWIRLFSAILPDQCRKRLKIPFHAPAKLLRDFRRLTSVHARLPEWNAGLACHELP